MKILITESQYNMLIDGHKDDLFGDYLFAGDVPREYGYYAPEYEKDTELEEELFMFLLNHYKQNTYTSSEYENDDIARFIYYFKHIRDSNKFSDIIDTNLDDEDYIFRGSCKKMDKSFFVDDNVKIFIHNDVYYFVFDKMDYTHKNNIQSWTSDFDVAKKFAGMTCQMPIVYVSKAKHGDLYFNEEFAQTLSEREESEVINIKKTMQLVPIIILDKNKLDRYAKRGDIDMNWYDSLPKMKINNINDILSNIDL